MRYVARVGDLGACRSRGYGQHEHRHGTTDATDDDITIALSDAVNRTTAGSGAYRHIVTPSATEANTRRFTMQFDVNGRIYTHMDVQPLGWRLSLVDGFMDLELDFGSRWVSHVQFIPTPGVVATSNGVLYTAGAYSGSDTAAVTYNVICSAAGAIGDGTTSLQTKLSTDGGYSAARLVYNDVPFELLSQAGAQSGIFLLFTRLTAAMRCFMVCNRSASASESPFIG